MNIERFPGGFTLHLSVNRLVEMAMGDGISIGYERKGVDGGSFIAGGYMERSAIFGKGDSKLLEDTESEQWRHEYFRSLAGRLIFSKITSEHGRVWKIVLVDYASPHKTIWGEENVFESERHYTFNQEIIYVQPEDRYLNIHFTPRHKASSPEKFDYDYLDRRILAEGLAEYLLFLRDLRTSPKLAGIRVIRGVTHPRMARIAVRKLGFHILKDGRMIGLHGLDSFEDDKCSVKIIGLKEELIERAPDVARDLARLANKSSRKRLGSNPVSHPMV